MAFGFGGFLGAQFTKWDQQQRAELQRILAE